MTRDLIVSEGAAGERLDVFLVEALALNRSQAQRLIRHGRALVGGAQQKSGYHLHTGDHITVTEEILPTASEPPDLAVLYEDDDLAVIDKPAGLVVHPGAGTAGSATVVDFARTKSTDPDPDRPGIVHRLDKDTSGLLVIAKNPQAKIFLQRQFAGRQVHKTYLVLASGRLDPADALIRLPVGRDPQHPTRRRVTATGRPAETRYHTLANLGSYTLLEARPLTGRTHQIRVHFASVGHAVAGDTVYGPSKRPLGLSRQFLHATRLSFLSPSGVTVDVTSPLPADLEAVVQALGGSGIIDG